MKIAGVTLNSFLRIGLIAAVFIILLKYAVARLPLPEGARTAVGAI